MTTALTAPIQNDATERFSAEGRSKAAELTAQVNAISRAKVDAVADTRAFRMEVTPATKMPAGERVPELWRTQIVVLGGEADGVRMTLNDTAHDQMANRLGIPKDYYRRLLVDHPALVCANVNTLMHKEADARLFRMLKPITAEDRQRAELTGTKLTLRAVLGKSYRPMDDAELLATVLPVMEQHGAYLREFSLDERRMHAKFLTVEKSVQEIRARVGYDATAVQGTAAARIAGRDLSWVDEVVRAGAYLRNSETGFASLSVSAVWEILKCLNGMICPAETRQRHVGSRRSADDAELSYLSSDAQLLDNAATMAKVRDALVAALDERKQVANGNLLLLAKAENVTRPAEVPLFQFVGNIGNALGLTDTETETMKAETMHSVGVEGGETRFSYVQALTATARQMTDYDRRTEYERAGWKLLQGDTTELLKLAAEGAKASRN